MTTAPTPHAPRPTPLYLILTLNLFLSLAYGIVNPLFEAPDEHHHYFTAQWIADHGRLPSVPQPAEERFFVPQRASDWLGQEAAQPPLYYVLASLIIAPFNTDNARQQTIHNPFVRLGDAAARVNVNAFAHGHDGWLWRGHVLAAHLLRLLSAVMGMVTVWLIYQSGCLLWPDYPQRALLAAGLIAFLPQFTFQFSTISNDTLVTLLATWTLYQLLQVTSYRLQVSPWRWALLGVTIGLTALTKNQGLVLLIFAVGFVIAKTINLHSSSLTPHLFSFIPSSSSLLLPLCALILALPLWLRNWQLYGDFTAANQFVILAGGERGYTLGQALGEWPAIFYSFFANFGWFNVIPPRWVYGVWLIIVGMAILGSMCSLMQGREGTKGEKEAVKANRGSKKNKTRNTQHVTRFFTSTPLLLLGWFLAVFAALMVFNMQTPAAQGRLLFPALLPLGLGLGYGMERFLFHVSGSKLLSLLKSKAKASPSSFFILHTSYFILLFFINLYCLFFVIRPVYALPQVHAEIPDGATMYNASLGGGVTLVAAEVLTPQAHPAQYVELMLYWQREEALRERPEVVIELFGRQQQLVGKLQSWHGRGLYPADFWPTNTLMAERTAVRIDPINEDDELNHFPTLANINVKLAGQTAVQDIGVVDVEPYTYAELHQNVLAQLGDYIELVQATTNEPVTAGDELSLQVVWQVHGDVAQNYATFVQLGEQGAEPLAQGDSIPLGGSYPTAYWKKGQVLGDEYTIAIPADLPPGEYSLYVGLYRPEPPFERLPLVINGERQPFDAYLVDIIEIVEQ